MHDAGPPGSKFEYSIRNHHCGATCGASWSCEGAPIVLGILLLIVSLLYASETETDDTMYMRDDEGEWQSCQPKT